MPASKILTPSRARDKLANTARSKGKLAPETLHARRELAAANIAAFIKRTIDKAPPLTHEQRDQLAVLLRGRPSDTDEAA